MSGGADARVAGRDAEEGREEPAHVWQSREVRWSAASGVLLGAGFVLGLVSGVPGWLVMGLYVTSTVAGVRFFAAEAVAELAREREVGIELLMTVAALTAGMLGLWGEAATLAFLYSISEALEEFTEDRTRGAIRALMDLAPKTVTRLLPGGGEEVAEVADLAAGDVFLVRPGQAVATDGRITEGASAVDESAVTGESVPVDKAPGDPVFAGTLNTTGALVVSATATAAGNTLAKIVHMVAQAQERKGHGEQFMRRFARIYSPAVLAAGGAVAVAGGLATGEWRTWLVRAATVVVAAAPCALVISIPVSYVAAIGHAGRRGVLIKGGVYLEALARLRVLALDKTGTLTQGRPQVVAVHPAAGQDEQELVAVAASVESRSEHPLARAVTACATQRGIAVRPVADFQSLTGAGAQARIDGTSYAVGSPALAVERGADLGVLDAAVTHAQSQGQTAIVVLRAGKPLGVLAVADVLRPHAAEAMRALHQLGIERLVMLSGDNQRTAQAIAAQVGIDDVAAGLTPAGKAHAVTGLAERHGAVGMVGDGVNDAPALAAASVGIAMGTAGSDVALETADVALMADDLSKLTEAVRIGRRTRTVVRQNVALGLVILAVLVPGALLGAFSLPVAVLAHEFSEIVVIANGVRLARG